MSNIEKQRVLVCHTGRMEYGTAWDLQKRIQARLIEAKTETPQPALPHVFLLVDHPPVFTLGKNGSTSNLLLTNEELGSRGATFFHIDRGGDITYHGPGQIVGYPILDLDRFFTDIGRYLRTLEEVIIRVCTDYGLEARRITGRTGVWTGADGAERKVAALGIKCSRWVTMHGFALNVNTDLEFFSCIVPCGIKDRGVTSLGEELQREIDESEVRGRLLAHFGELLEVCIEPITLRELEHHLIRDFELQID